MQVKHVLTMVLVLVVAALASPLSTAVPAGSAEATDASATRRTVEPFSTDFDYTVEWAFSTGQMYAVGVGCVQDTLIWVSAARTPTVNKFYIYDARTHNGVAIDSFNQFNSTSWGTRDLAYDPVEDVVWGGGDSRALDKIDATLHTRIANYTVAGSPVPAVIRAIEDDGDSLYSGDFTNVPVCKFSKTGTNSHGVGGTPPYAIYGLALDEGRGKMYATTADYSYMIIEYNFPAMTVADSVYVSEVEIFGGCDMLDENLLVVLGQCAIDSVFCFRLGGGAAKDVGVQAVLAPAGNMMPGMVAPKAEIKNYGTDPQSSIPVYCEIDSAGTNIYVDMQTYAGPLAPGATAEVTFSNWTSGPAGNTYDVTMWTNLTGDENPANDSAAGSVTIISPGAEDTIHVDGPYSNNAVGLTAGGTFFTAARLTPDMAADVIAVIFHTHTGETNQYAFVWEENTATLPGPVVESIPYTWVDSAWIRCDLASPYRIEAGEDVWVGPRTTHAAGKYPIGVDAGPGVVQRGGWINYDGSWTELRTLGLNFNWNIRAIVRYLGGVEEQILEPAPFGSYGVQPSVVRDRAQISYTLNRASSVELGIYDVTGQLVRTLVSGIVEPGKWTSTWDRTAQDGSRVARGTYFYRLVVDGESVGGKAVVVE